MHVRLDTCQKLFKNASGRHFTARFSSKVILETDNNQNPLGTGDVKKRAVPTPDFLPEVQRMLMG